MATPYYLTDDEYREITDTRKDWTVHTYADGYGRWHCTVSSAAGWGNATPHHIGQHIRALRERARRAIRAEIEQRQHLSSGTIRLSLVDTTSTSTGVILSVTFAESE